MYSNFLTNSRVRRWALFLCMACFLSAVGVLSIKKVVREFASDIITTKSLASWGIGVQGSAVKYADLKTSFFAPQVVITGLVIDTLYASFEIDQLGFSYGLFSRNSSIKFSDGYIHVSAGDQKGGRLKCKVESGLDIRWRDSAALYFLKRILFGKGVANSVVKVSYVDDGGAYCTNHLGEEESVASAYEKLRISLSFPEDDTLRADALMHLKVKEGMGSLLLNMDGILVQKDRDDGATKVNITSLGLEGESFSVMLDGNMAISQKCALMSFRRCTYNMNLEVRKFDELSNFVKAGVLELLGDEIGKHKNGEQLLTFLDSIFDVIRASAVLTNAEEDIVKITLNSTEKGGLVIDGIPINKIKDDVIKKFRSIQGHDALM